MINTLAILIGNILSIVIVTILVLNLPYGFVKERIQTKVFAFFSVPIIMGAVFGIGSAFFDGLPGDFGRIMVTICGTAGIIMPVLMGFIFWLYVETSAKGSLSAAKNKVIVALIPVVVALLLTIINLFNHLVFYVSEDNVYYRGPLGLVAYVLSPVYLVVSLVRITYIKSQKRGFLFVPIVGVFLPITVIAVIQARFYGILQAWMGFAVAMISLYMGMQKDLLYTDSMTGVFNRIYFDYVMEEAVSKKQSLGGVMLDIDHFKSINDTLGHSVGDEVIKKAAYILKISAADNANVIRVGGDEFLIILPTDNEEDLENIKNNIRDNCIKEGQTKALPTKIEFSMGSGIYIPGETAESQWLSEMDKNMYIEKALHRGERRNRRASHGSSL